MNLFFTITNYFTRMPMDDFGTIYPQFFVVIIAGVLMALAFQIILTALSVAMGISMSGDVKQSYVNAKVRPNSKETNGKNTFDQDYDDNGMSTGVKVSSAFGIWSMITTSLALFGACALALNLSLFESTSTNLTVALVIWALFFIILFYLETKIVNTVIGGLVNTATSGLKSSSNMVKQLFSASEEQKMEHVIDSSIEKIRKEFDINLDTSKLSDTLDSFLSKVDTKVPDYDTLKNDLESIMKKSSSKNNSGKFMAIQQVLTKAINKAESNDDSSSKDKSDKLKNILSELKDAYDSDSSTAEGVRDVVAEHTPLSQTQIDDKINSIKDFISGTTSDNMSDNNLQKELQKIISDPKSIKQIFSNGKGTFNRESIVESLSNNTNIDKQKIESYAIKIEKVLTNFKTSVSNVSMDSLKDDAQKSIENFFNSTERQELNYDDLTRDLDKILNNPKDSLSIIKNRFSKFDGDTVKALVTNNKYIDESQIDELSDQINSYISKAKDNVSKIEHKAHEQFEIIKRKAVIQAEHTRKTAASAAWWLVITAISSAGFAMLGGWVELF